MCLLRLKFVVFFSCVAARAVAGPSITSRAAKALVQFESTLVYIMFIILESTLVLLKYIYCVWRMTPQRNACTAH